LWIKDKKYQFFKKNGYIGLTILNPNQPTKSIDMEFDITKDTETKLCKPFYSLKTPLKLGKYIANGSSAIVFEQGVSEAAKIFYDKDKFEGNLTYSLAFEMLSKFEEKKHFDVTEVIDFGFAKFDLRGITKVDSSAANYIYHMYVTPFILYPRYERGPEHPFKQPMSPLTVFSYFWMDYCLMKNYSIELSDNSISNSFTKKIDKDVRFVIGEDCFVFKFDTKNPQYMYRKIDTDLFVETTDNAGSPERYYSEALIKPMDFVNTSITLKECNNNNYALSWEYRLQGTDYTQISIEYLLNERLTMILMHY
jgi:hypothetical protein